MNCKSFIPGYHTMRDLNEDTGNSWPTCYGNNMLNRHLYNGCMYSFLNGYSEYDKEILKRTMLEHEAIFRKQVYELHRLYRIQKDLMGEFQKNGLNRFPPWNGKSNTGSSFSEAQSQAAELIYQFCHLPSLSNSQSRETTTVTNTNVSPISTLQSCFNAVENGESNKIMFDLQAPADVYFDGEDSEGSQKEEIACLSSANTASYSRKFNGDDENEVKLTLGGAHKFDSYRKNTLLHHLADLNAPIEEASLKGLDYSLSPRHADLETRIDENHRPSFSVRSTSFRLQFSPSKNQDCDESGSSSILSAVKKELNQACSQYHDETGKSKIDFSLDSEKEKCSLLRPIKAKDILFDDPNKTEVLLIPKKGNSSEIQRRSLDSAFSDNHEKRASSLLHSLAISSSSNLNVSTLPLLKMKPSDDENQPSSPIQTTSSFDKSTSMSNFGISDATADERLQFCHDLRSLHLENGKFFHQNEFNQGFHQYLNSTSLLGATNNNLNLNSREIGSFGIGDGKTAPCNESLNLNNLSSNVDLCFDKFRVESEGKIEIKSSIPSCNLEDLSANHHCSEKKRRTNEVSKCLVGEKTIELSTFNNIQPSLDFFTEKRMSVRSQFSNINPFSTEKEASTENMSFGNHIDPNSKVEFIDEPNFVKMMSKSSIAISSPATHISSSSKDFTLIDIHAPGMPPDEDNTPEMDFISCDISNNLNKNECSIDMLVERAAECIITLSSNKLKHLDNGCVAFEPPCNTLYWFANMALSTSCMRNSDVEMDLFEKMTLQLEEMIPEVAWHSPQEREDLQNGEKSRALLLLTKPRRGQARKRRQRRDFQKDTLPGIATLSKQEVVEDLQLFSEVMKASGFHCELSEGRRHGSRNGTKAKAKKRRLPRKNTATATKERRQTLFLFSKNVSNSVFEVDRPGMVGWGRTTTRRRRPRCHPPQSVPVALT